MSRGEYSYIRVLSDELFLKWTVKTVNFKRNSSSRVRIYEYPPPINDRSSFKNLVICSKIVLFVLIRTSKRALDIFRLLLTFQNN